MHQTSTVPLIAGEPPILPDEARKHGLKPLTMGFRVPDEEWIIRKILLDLTCEAPFCLAGIAIPHAIVHVGYKDYEVWAKPQKPAEARDSG